MLPIEPMNDDDLRAVKGLALGAAIGAWIWAAIAFVIYLA